MINLLLDLMFLLGVLLFSSAGLRVIGIICATLLLIHIIIESRKPYSIPMKVIGITGCVLAVFGSGLYVLCTALWMIIGVCTFFMVFIISDSPIKMFPHVFFIGDVTLIAGLAISIAWLHIKGIYNRRNRKETDKC